MFHEGYLLGYDIGSSSIKASIISLKTGKLVASAISSDVEQGIDRVVRSILSWDACEFAAKRLDEATLMQHLAKKIRQRPKI